MIALTPELALAQKMADKAAKIAMSQFRKTELVKNKAGPEGFDPATRADIDIETCMREMIQQAFPDHSIHGEELGLVQKSPDAPLWMLDPIDGTRNYFAGSLFWGILIALSKNDSVRLGIIDHPPTGERFVAENGKGFWQQGAQTRPLKVRQNVPLEQAVLAATTPQMFLQKGELEAFNEISHRAAITLYGGNCYFYGLLALGQIDLVIESALQPYDVHALIPIIEAAGGIITNWQNDDPRAGGQIIAAASAELHEAALNMLAPAAK